jgi:hypothetical protein
MQRQGFLTLDDYYFDRPAMPLTRIVNAPDPQCISVTDWAKAYLAGTEPGDLTPLQVADNLDGYAAVTLEALPALREQMGDNVELKETLNDMESMAYLGRYYADKMRGAAKLAVYRESDRQDRQYLDQAIAHLEDAVDEWKAYAAVLTSQYKTSLLARTNFLDWNETLKDVEKEVVTVKEERDYPQVGFANLEDGACIPAGSELRVEVEATDGNGVPEVKLRLNGLVLNSEDNTGSTFVWSASSDELLKSLKTGMYQLEAVAEDKNGLRSHEEISFAVGNASPSMAGDWRDEVYQVIMEEGEILKDGENRDIPRLECFLTLEEDGRLLLFNGSPGNRNGIIWATRGKADRPTPQPVPYRFYTIVDDGQLVVGRGTPDDPDVVLWQSGEVFGPGPYKLGITASRRLVVFRDRGKRTENVWKSPVRN